MSMIPFNTNEPMVRTMQSDSAGYASYDIYRVNGMQADAPLSSLLEYSGTCYAPDGYEDVNFGPILRSLVSDQERNIRTLQYVNSQYCAVTQGTFTFNSYFTVVDSSSANNDTWSVIYDTRGLTAYETGARTSSYTPGYGYPANVFPDREVRQGQYFSLMWRMPSNYREMESVTLGCTYVYDTSAGGLPVQVQTDQVLDPSLTGQSFRYSGAADWQTWGDGNNVVWAQFWIENEKQQRTVISPRLYPRWCDEPGTIYLYYVNSLGGIDFVRGTRTSAPSVNVERSTYETNVDIDERLKFGEEVYSQRRWNTYSFHTDIVSDDESFNLADIVNARWAWVCIPGETPEWRSVRVTDTTAKVKQRRNEGDRVYSYDFTLEDSIKNKVV